MCGFKSLYKANVARHEKVIHGRGDGDTLRCSLCTFTTEKGMASLNMHRRMSHNNGNEEHVCGDCNFSTKYLGALRRHITIIHAGR